jgi:hypothetical protein
MPTCCQLHHHTRLDRRLSLTFQGSVQANALCPYLLWADSPSKAREKDENRLKRPESPNHAGGNANRFPNEAACRLVNVVIAKLVQARS